MPSSQGKEADVVIFSCVRAHSRHGVGFLSDVRRMNVGLTRAQRALWILGNSSTLKVPCAGPCIAAIIALRSNGFDMFARTITLWPVWLING